MNTIPINGKIRDMLHERRMVNELYEYQNLIHKNDSISVPRNVSRDEFEVHLLLVKGKGKPWEKHPERLKEILNACIEHNYINQDGNYIVVSVEGIFLKSFWGFIEEFLKRFNTTTTKLITIIVSFGIGALTVDGMRLLIAWIQKIL